MTVLNMRDKSRNTSNEVYVGRTPTGRHHFGNPFSHKTGTKAKMLVATRAEAIAAYAAWLEGTDSQEVEPKRRAWILRHMGDLRGKDLTCWCAPLACHADVLLEVANR